MKIAQIAPPWIAISPQSYGDTENVIYRLVEELVAHGHDVTLFAPEDAHTSAKHVAFIPQSLITAGVPWQANLKAYYHLHKSLEYIARHDFDIVHSHLSSSGDMYLFPLSAGLATPHVTTLHSHFPFDTGPDGWVGDADTHFMEWSENLQFVAVSDDARRHQRLPINIAAIIHHGVQVPSASPSYDTSKAAFLWIGRFTREDGAHLAIAAARHAHVPLMLMGTKDLQNREAMYYFQHMVAPFIDDQRIRLLNPAIGETKHEILRNARGLLHTAERNEPFSTISIEAMAQGCPVIALDRGSLSEVVIDGETGFLADDTITMAQAIGQVNTLKREGIRQYAEHCFSTRIMTENYLRTYQKIIATQAFARVTEPLQEQPVHVSHSVLTA